MSASGQRDTVLVTGGLGYIGAHAVVALEEAGHRTLVIDNLAALSFSLDALLDMAHGGGPRHSLFALGYAGWAPNQLENEIARGSWFTIAPDEALLFDDDVDTKWERALARRGIDL